MIFVTLNMGRRCPYAAIKKSESSSLTTGFQVENCEEDRTNTSKLGFEPPE
jgi:hypothetical protein